MFRQAFTTSSSVHRCFRKPCVEKWASLSSTMTKINAPNCRMLSSSERDPSSLSKPRQSNRESFQSIPLDSPVLDYIKMIGLGRSAAKPPRQRKKRKKHDVIKDEEFFQSNTRSHLPSHGKGQKEGSSISSSFLPPPPFSPTQPLDEREFSSGFQVRRLPVKVIGSAASKDDRLPSNIKRLPEVALAGRSNVGKSTLLNALLYGNITLLPNVSDEKYRRPRLMERAKMPKGVKAIMSSKPGETREITFYRLTSELKAEKEKHYLAMLLVDLPGYGFAYAKEEAAQKYKELMQHYLLDRGKTLKRVLLLIDARHGMKTADIEFLESLESIVYSREDRQKRNLPPIQVVLTKCDLVSQENLARRVVLVRQQLSESLRREPSRLPIMLVSAKPGVGFNNIRNNRSTGGVLELQRELAALVPKPAKPRGKSTTISNTGDNGDL